MSKHILGRAALAAASLALLTSAAPAMTFREQWIADDRLIMYFDGQIVNGDYARMLAFLSGLQSRNDRARLAASSSVVSLNSNGGVVVEAGKIAKAIREAQQKVVVENGNQCVSACFILFAAGVGRSVGPAAYLGVHSVSVDEIETQLSTSLTVDMARDLQRYGVPADIIGRLVTTGPKNIYRLTNTDLRSMATVVDISVTVAKASPAPAVLPAPPSPPKAHVPPPPSRMMYGTAQGMPGGKAIKF